MHQVSDDGSLFWSIHSGMLTEVFPERKGDLNPGNP